MGLRMFRCDTAQALGDNLVSFIYPIVLMAGFNLCYHRSQDFYPVFLEDQAGMEATQPTVVTVVGQIGALIDRYAIGYIGTFFGRRLTMLMSCVLGGVIIPAYILPQNMSLAACALLENF
ncbi:hypothetical protein N7449_009002 [Penicillium cf. viridicatum]|uniref:Major facilitator superfamily (MFS) profile domain-containing protein n=1 Tax=Penicillium cf. viridicatum TaxID=2972119 RepID=A0A9W9J9I1_9EURO|nr:hypothetical protein N7449_009002 [Penicillium cf. viridicatum]